MSGMLRDESDRLATPAAPMVRAFDLSAHLLRRWRQATGMTLRELARASGYDLAWVAAWEMGTYAVPDAAYGPLLRALLAAQGRCEMGRRQGRVGMRGVEDEDEERMGEW